MLNKKIKKTLHYIAPAIQAWHGKAWQARQGRSSAIAAHYFGCDFVGTELDPDYYAAAVERFDNETAQAAMF